MSMTRSLSLALVLFLAALAVPAAVLGPSGGAGGEEFTDAPPRGATLVEVRVRSASFIDGMQVVWNTPDGYREGPRHGGMGGATDTFKLDAGDHIVKMTGAHNGRFVTRLQFTTANGRTSRVYGEGGSGDAAFIYEAPEGHLIRGFHGRAGSFIDAIGIVMAKAPR